MHLVGKPPPGPAVPPPARLGRRRVTTRAEIEHVALQLFTDRGFEATTVEDIASAAGIGRRTFFRYFPSKNDVPWGDFDHELISMRDLLRSVHADMPMMDAIRWAVREFNTVHPDEEPWHRRRIALIPHVPALQAHSTLRYRAWRDVIAEFVAARTGARRDSLLPQAVGYASLGAAVAAYEQWLDGGGDLVSLLDVAFRLLATGFAE